MSPEVFEAPPPSPACRLMPGTFRSASLSVVTPWASMTSRGITSIVCGTSMSGSAYLGEDGLGCGTAPVTSTASDARRISREMLLGAVTRDVTLVPSIARATACSAVKTPDTPDEETSPIALFAIVIRTPEMRSISASTPLSGPAGMSNRNCR